jgi:hypothetical protein
MSSIWDDEYAEILKGHPENQWIPFMLGDIGDSDAVEIFCVHTSEPHGMISYGWDGPKKFMILDQGCSDLPKKQLKPIHEKLFKLAGAMAIMLNLTFPKGLPDV